MIQLLYWLIGRGYRLPDVLDPDEIIEQFVMIEGRKLRINLQELRDKMPQFPIHDLTLCASICSSAEGRRLITKLEIPRQIIPSAGQYDPYRSPFWSQTKKSVTAFSRTLFVLDGKTLGAREQLAGEEEVIFLSGEKALCSKQSLRDINRWSEQSHLIFDGQAHPLKASDRIQCAVGSSRFKVSIATLNLIETIRDRILNDEKFLLFTYYFNQCPLNNMMYAMTSDVQRLWGACLFPDSRMERNFQLITDKHHKITKILISIRGYFNGGELPRGMVEPREELKLGAFHGTTLINLHSGAAFVRTYVEIFPKEWVY